MLLISLEYNLINNNDLLVFKRLCKILLTNLMQAHYAFKAVCVHYIVVISTSNLAMPIHGFQLLSLPKDKQNFKALQHNTSR